MNKKVKSFKHYSDTINRLEFTRFILYKTMAGYGRYWVIMEMLCVAPLNRLSILDYPIIARECWTTVEDIKDIIENFDLFVIKDNMFYSKQMEYGVKKSLDAEKRLEKYCIFIEEKQYNPKYYLTPTWKKKRAMKIKLSKNKCESCGSEERLNVHHLHYKTFTKESLSDLKTLCAKCHRIAHSLN